MKKAILTLNLILYFTYSWGQINLPVRDGINMTQLGDYIYFSSSKIGIPEVKMWVASEMMGEEPIIYQSGLPSQIKYTFDFVAVHIDRNNDIIAKEVKPNKDDSYRWSYSEHPAIRTWDVIVNYRNKDSVLIKRNFRVSISDFTKDVKHDYPKYNPGFDAYYNIYLHEVSIPRLFGDFCITRKKDDLREKTFYYQDNEGYTKKAVEYYYFVYRDTLSLSKYVITYEKGKEISSEEMELVTKGNGTYQEVYDNEKIKVKGELRMNQKTGVWSYYHNDGSLKVVYNYNNGKLDGEAKYYFKGNNKLQRIDLFNNGIFIGPKKVFDANGNQILNDGNGIFQSHYENGQLEAEITYKDGCRDGIAIWYYPNGKLKQKTIYRYDEESKPMGLRWEIISIFDPNGNPLEKGTLKNGNGSWLQYDNNGKKTGVSYYENGKAI